MDPVPYGALAFFFAEVLVLIIIILSARNNYGLSDGIIPQTVRQCQTVKLIKLRVASATKSRTNSFQSSSFDQSFEEESRVLT